MDLSNKILFFFSALGVFNGFIFSVYIFFFHKEKRIVNYLLGILLLLICIRVGVSCFYFFEESIHKVFIQIGLMANFFMGPFLYYYVKTSLSEINILRKQSVMYLGILILFIVVFSILFPFTAHPIFWDHKMRFLTHIVLSVYLLMSFLLILPVLKQIKKSSSLQKGLVIIVFATILMALGFVVSLYTTYVLGPVWFSLVLYTIVILLFFKRKIIKIFETKVSSKKIKEEEANDLILVLEKLMIEKKLFKTSNLKIDDVAQQLQITSNRLSQLLNENIGKSFTLFVNEYRVKEAKLLLVTNTNYTIEAIGYESGFTSKSSFFSTLKKMTNTTPSAFKKASF